jgi:hypothetical protein
LAAILFPVFAQAREKARQSSCTSNLKQISTATLMYLQDYDEIFPVWDGRTPVTAAVLPRNLRRRGGGWRVGQGDIGGSNGCGGFEGLRLLLSVTPTGVVTGFGLASGSAKDQPMAETFLALRHQPDARLSSVGAPAPGV